jgi:hypothetical protein
MKSSRGSTLLWLRTRLRKAHKEAAMSRTTKALSGPAKDKVLRALVSGTEAVPADVAARVAEVLARSISEVRVRRDAWDATRGITVEPTVTLPRAVAVSAQPAPTPVPAQAASATAAAAAFDPYAFSAVSILTKKGKAALISAFDTIATAADLHKIAIAQHLAIDPALADVTGIRAALVAATERRIAERKAAAS